MGERWQASEEHARTRLGGGLALFEVRRTRLVGRHAERLLLRQALTDVLARRRPQVVLIHGAEGLGKTRLAEWLCELAGELGLARVERCGHGQVPGPSDGMIDLLRGLLRVRRSTPSETRNRILERLANPGDSASWLGAAACKLLMDDEDDPWIFEDPAERYGIAAAIAAHEALERPLLLLTDDLDLGTDVVGMLLRVLEARPPTATPLLVLGTLRGDLADPGSPAEDQLSELCRHERVSHIQLKGLPNTDMRLLVDDSIVLEPGLVTQVIGRAAGNPLYARRLLADWVADAALTPTAQGFVLKEGVIAGLPRDLRNLWEGPLARLITGAESPSLDALLLPAALGDGFPTSEWRLAAGTLGLEQTEPALDRLLGCGLLRPLRGRLSFAHGAAREALEARARSLGRWKVLAGAAAAQLLRRRPPEPLRAGRLFADAERWGEAIVALLTAARDARERPDFLAATKLFDEVERLLARAGAERADPRYVRVALERCTLHRHLGDDEQCWQAIELAMASPAMKTEPSLRAEALRSRGILHREAGRLEDARSDLTAALVLFRAMGDEDSVERTQQSFGYLLRGIGEYDGAVAAFEEAITLARREGKSAGLTVALTGLGTVYRERGQWAKARDLLEEAVETHHRCGRLRGLAVALRELGGVRNQLGEAPEGIAQIRRGLALAKAVSSAHIIGDFHNELGECLRMAGRSDEARTEYERSIRCYPGDDWGWSFVPRCNLGLLELQAGNYIDALAVVCGARDTAARQGRLSVLFLLDSFELHCQAGLGDRSAARLLLRRLTEALLGDVRMDTDVASSVSAAAGLLAELGEQALAAEAARLASQCEAIIER